MELRIQIQPVGDTTLSEIALISAALRSHFEKLTEVDFVTPVRAPAPEGTKGWIEVVGAMALKLIPGSAIVTGLLGVVKAYASRPGSPPFTVEFSVDGSVKATYDPRTGSIGQFAALVALIKPQPKPT